MNASGQHWPFSRHLEVLGQDRKWCEMIDPPHLFSPLKVRLIVLENLTGLSTGVGGARSQG